MHNFDSRKTVAKATRASDLGQINEGKSKKQIKATAKKIRCMGVDVVEATIGEKRYRVKGDPRKSGTVWVFRKTPGSGWHPSQFQPLPRHHQNGPVAKAVREAIAKAIGE